VRDGGTRIGPVVAGGVLLGIGLGGFLDGIVLHQILQWHNMLSSIVPPTDLVSMKVNMLWDGLFHALTWIVTVAGVARIWSAARRSDVRLSTRSLVASLGIGWGLFNVVEGVIDHQLLGIHHVHPGQNELAWDLGFLALSAIMLIAGALVVRSDRPARSFAHGAPSPA
jgi:uncharacterized membrane protein